MTAIMSNFMGYAKTVLARARQVYDRVVQKTRAEIEERPQLIAYTVVVIGELCNARMLSENPQLLMGTALTGVGISLIEMLAEARRVPTEAEIRSRRVQAPRSQL